jgi:hypothetical protein
VEREFDVRLEGRTAPAPLDRGIGHMNAGSRVNDMAVQPQERDA